MGPAPGRRLRGPRGLSPAPPHPVTPHPVTLHLVRHAAHGLLPHTLAGRMPGVPLSAEGRDQAAALGRWAAPRPIRAVLSSPVQRAMETAAAMGAVTVEPGLEEIDFGHWTGRRFDALDADPDWHRWNRLRALARCPGGESMVEAQARALAAVDRLRTGHPGAELVAVSHADVIKAVLAAALGLPLDALHRFSVDPARISTLTLFADGVRVDGINLPAP